MGLRSAVMTGTLTTLLGAGIAFGCECGNYPEILTCKKDIPKPAYARVYGKGEAQVKTFNLRLDLDDDDVYEHMSLAMSAREMVVVGVKTTRVNFWQYSLTLRVAGDAGDRVTSAYRIEGLNKAEALLLKLRLPGLLGEAQKYGNMRIGLERYLIEEEDAVVLDPASEQQHFDAQVRKAEERICGKSSL